MNGLHTTHAQWNGDSFEEAIDDRMKQLVREGVMAGQVVPFAAPAIPQTVWTLHALIRLGATAMPHSPTTTADHLAFVRQSTHTPTQPDTWLRLTTTGTTGTPKLVDLTKTQIEASAAASKKRLGCTNTDRWLCCLPLHHIAGLSILMRNRLYGCPTLLHERFDPLMVSVAIEAEDVQLVSLVPTMLSRLIQVRNGKPFPPTLRAILLGGAPCPADLLDQCRTMNAPVALTWGMTETASQIATRAPGDLRRDSDVGLPLDGVRIEVHNEQLVVSGNIAPNGRFVTDDRGALDEMGRVVVHGRGSALIISGGENIDPRRIETVIERHPSVRACVVVGRADSEWGQRPVAFVATDQNEPLKDWLSDKLLRHEVPAEIHCVTELPRNEMGKIDRKGLRDQAQLLHRASKRLRN